jgi:hypothetical protein
MSEEIPNQSQELKISGCEPPEKPRKIETQARNTPKSDFF